MYGYWYFINASVATGTSIYNWLALVRVSCNWSEFEYFAGESFDENGDQKIEQYVVAERHQEDEVQRRPRRRPRHARVQHLVPIFLRQNLPTHNGYWPLGVWQSLAAVVLVRLSHPGRLSGALYYSYTYLLT